MNRWRKPDYAWKFDYGVVISSASSEPEYKTRLVRTKSHDAQVESRNYSPERRLACVSIDGTHILPVKELQ